MMYVGHIGNMQIDRQWFNSLATAVFRGNPQVQRYIRDKQTRHSFWDMMNNAPERYYHVYQCAPSTETRGRRTEHDNGCGSYEIFSSKIGLRNDQKIQASPCSECTNRKRLNSGLVTTFGSSRCAEIYARVMNYQRECSITSNNYTSERNLLITADDLEDTFNELLSMAQGSEVIS